MNRLLSIIIVGWILGASAQIQAETNTLDSPPQESGVAYSADFVRQPTDYGGRVGGIDWAPLISCDVDVNGDARWRILGPLFETREAADARSMWAVHPFYSTVKDPSDQRQESDVLWPMWIGKRHRNMFQWRLAVFTLWRDYDVTDPRSRYSLWILPVYFQGRSADRHPYLAVFPLGGTIRDIIVWDEVWFVLFPLTGYARINEIRTHTYLWPVISSTRGPIDKRFRIFPFYGYSIREHDYDKRFILWPFWTSARYKYENASGYGYILFPLFGHVKLTDQESWMLAPPFIRFSKGLQLNQINCPWPVFQYSSGVIEKLYFWPIWGHKTIGDIHTAFLLWPIGLSSRRVTPKGENHRIFVLPILYSETTTRRAADVVDFRVFKFWPFFSYRRDADVSRFRLPSLCPFKDFAVIDRNYAPLWTLYTHSACGDVKEDELLWGLFQYRRSSAGMLKTSLFPVFSITRDDARKGMEWSFLKGLVAHEREGDRQYVRFLYVFRW